MIDIQNIFDDGNFDEPIDKHTRFVWAWIILFLLSTPIQLFLILISEEHYAYKIFWWFNGYNSVSPFSIGNYAHSQYMHWIEESKYQDCNLFNRWNTP